MATQAQKLQEIDKELTELKGEVRFNENILLRNENLIHELADISYELKSRADLVDERIKQMLRALEHNHEDIESLRRDQIKSQTEIMNHITNLEKWRWWFVGVIATVAAAVPMIIEFMFHS